ncbi:MAG: hypothetical protein IPK27_00255 [Rhodanobacteraceae bacterium]|nr:hypothetical protein [Rhodanobacteraceae bacterium]
MSARARLLLVVLALLLPLVALADYKKDYQDGVAAAEKGNWAEVRRLMQAAIAENPTPVPRMRTYGTNFIPYVPHYYLGLANARLDDCNAAVGAFKTAASARVVAGLPALASEQSTQLKGCEQRLLAAANPPPTGQPTTAPAGTQPTTQPTSQPTTQPTRPPVAPTQPAVAETRPAPGVTPLGSAQTAPVQTALAASDRRIAAIEGRLGSAPLAGTGDARALSRELGQLKSQRQQLGASLERARAAGDARSLQTVKADAGKLDTGLASLDERAQAASAGLAEALAAQTLAQARKRGNDALARLDGRLTAASQAGIASDAAARSQAAAQRQALERALGGKDPKAIDSALASAASAIRGLDAAIAAAPKPAPAELRTLVGWYLAANYAEAARWNQLDRLTDDRARAHALLLRAAARWHLYVRGGEQDQGLIAAVDADLRDAKRRDQTLKPNAQVFSPKLIARFAGL